jgi:general nucleoside transport system ATP-binding protein
MTAINKCFGDVEALKSVDLTVQPGTIHAVVGENGAGKTTLMRVLNGAVAPDSGTITVNGQSMRFASSKEAIAAGIGMVSQHYGIIPQLTCLQNLVLGAEGGPLLHPKELEKRAKVLASTMGFDFDWHADAETLSPAGAQKLEILKLLWREARIMILDEPTAMLSPADGEALFGSLRRLAGAGATVILVTHRLPEVMDHCERVTVLRNGSVVADLEVSNTTAQDLASHIVGGNTQSPPPLGQSPISAVLMAVEDLWVKNDRGGDALNGVSFNVRAGEIVGLAGVDGNGQRELFEAIFGLRRPHRGVITFRAEEMEGVSTAERLYRGMQIIPFDRHAEALIEEWSLEENAALGLQRRPPHSAGRFVDSAGRRDAAVAIADRFRTRYSRLEQPASSLSGGNQQRFVVGRVLSSKPSILLAFQPARGLDINATEEVYAGLRQMCNEGGTVLVVSFDLDELLVHCDRILAVNQGRVLDPQTRDREAIGRLMVGAA